MELIYLATSIAAKTNSHYYLLKDVLTYSFVAKAPTNINYSQCQFTRAKLGGSLGVLWANATSLAVLYYYYYC